MATQTSTDTWKREELLRLGFTTYQAEVLMHIPGLGVGDIREKFISKGCTPDLAWRILCPHECAEDHD